MSIRRMTLWVAVLLMGCGAGLRAQAAPDQARFTILISNDDGYDAPGIRALVDSLLPIAHVVVAAPQTQESGVGHAITYREPIMVRDIADPRGVRWYAIGAHPATCVRLALTTLLASPPDLVVSGINSGDNIGVSAWVSGTVAAAREGPLHGVPGIAVSTNPAGPGDYAYTAGVVRTLIQHLRDKRLLGPSMLLNVNVPSGGAAAVRGVRVARMSLAMGTERYERRVSPRGAVYYWDDWRAPQNDVTAGTDLDWFTRGYVAIVPLTVDQTANAALSALGSALDEGN